GRTLQGYTYPKGMVTDGGAFDGTVSVGAAFDDNRGHAMAYFGYRKVNAVTQQRRDYSACALQDADTRLTHRNHQLRCGGSLTSVPGNAVVFATYTNTPTPFVTSTVAGLGAGTLTPFAAGPRFNFNPTNYFQR